MALKFNDFFLTLRFCTINWVRRCIVKLSLPFMSLLVEADMLLRGHLCPWRIQVVAKAMFLGYINVYFFYLTGNIVTRIRAI